MSEHIRKPACSRVLTEHIKLKSSYLKALHAFFASQVQSCNVSQVRAAMQAHPDMDVMQVYAGHEHLVRAVRAGCNTLVRMMVRKKHLSTNLPDDLIVTAILQAPQESMLKLVGNLIEVGANVNGRDRLGQSALATAISLEQPVVAKYLVDAGANVNTETQNKSFPIIEATKKGHEHLVRQLIAEGADVNARDAMGRTALFAAVGQGRVRLVDSLLRSGASTRLKDNSGIDPFVLAESQNLPGIQALLAASNKRQVAINE